MKNRKIGKYYMYYRRDGKPYNQMEDWARDFEVGKDRIVKQDAVNFGLFYISTVWLGLNHQFSPTGRPLIFETMVFCRFPLPRPRNHWYFKFRRHSNYCSELDMWRYSTEKESLAGHRVMVDEWKNPFKILQHLPRHLFGKY